MVGRSLAAAILAMLTVACSAAPPTPTPGGSAGSSVAGRYFAHIRRASDSTTAAGEHTFGGCQSGPTSAELILADLDAGKIDEPTALLYRVYAMFADTRLPAAYAGRWSEDGAALEQAEMVLETVPADIAAEIRPFLVRPTDPESVFNQAQRAHTSEPGSPPGASGQTSSRPLGLAVAQIGNPFGPGDFNCQPTGWGYIDSGSVSPGPGWRLWTACGDQTALAQVVELAGWMPRFYADETALMGPPLSDALGGPAEAGDGPIDIYLVDQCVSSGVRCLSSGFDDASEFGYAKSARPCVPSGAADKCSAFAVINRFAYNADTPSTLAHEFFHVLEFAHNRHGLNVGGRWNWFTEASAKWAQFRYYPASRPGRVYSFFENFMSTALGLTKTNGRNEYASFVWPLFMTESGPAGED